MRVQTHILPYIPTSLPNTDYTCSFSITDPSKQNIDEFIKVNLFRRSLEDFNSPSVFGGGVGGDSAPRLPAVGDIVFCHKLTVTQFNSRSQLIGYSNVDWWSITLLTRAAASGGSTSSLASSTGAENIPPSANRPSSSSSGMLSTLKSSPAFNLIREWCNRVAFPTSSSAGQIGYGGYPSTSSSNVIQIQSLQGRSSFGSSSGDNKPVPKIMEIDKVVNRYIHFNGLIVSVWRDPAPPYPGKRGELYVAIADFTRLGEQAGVGGSSSSGRGYS